MGEQPLDGAQVHHPAGNEAGEHVSRAQRSHDVGDARRAKVTRPRHLGYLRYLDHEHRHQDRVGGGDEEEVGTLQQGPLYVSEYFYKEFSCHS